MKLHSDHEGVVMQMLRRTLLALVFLVSLAGSVHAQDDPLPSWNDGAAKQAILEFVQATTVQGSPHFVPPAERIATFDQDGTLWVEHPMYSQVMYILERVPALVKAKPELARNAPYSTVLEILKGNVGINNQVQHYPIYANGSYCTWENSTAI